MVQHCSISLYADNTSIYVSNPDPSTVGNLPEEGLRHIREWLEHNGLKINVDNSTDSTVQSPKKPPGRPSRGETWDSSATEAVVCWVPRCHSGQALALSSSHWHCMEYLPMQNCSHQKSQFYLPGYIRRTLYLSLVLPHLEYCSVVWNDCGATPTSRLEHVQNYALCVILNKPLRSNTEEMPSQLSLPSLSCRRETSTIL